jgi:hypothetical protein
MIMIVAKQYYHLECDHEGCQSRSPHVGYEVAAWSDPIDLINSATEEEWLIKDGTHWCPDHVVFCIECEDVLVPNVIMVCDACQQNIDADDHEEGGSTQQGPSLTLANYRREIHHHD